MPASVINATINGINATGGNVAELELQVGGTTAITVNSAGYWVLANALPVASGGTGSNTGAFSGANITSLNASSVSSGTLAVANGGTGSNTLTANNVILGNGTSAVQFVAPGTSSNVLTSNGSAWVSQAAAGGGKLLQVVQTFKTDTATISVTTSANQDITGMSVTITPSSASNKILIFAQVSLSQVTADISGIALVRGSTEIGVGDANGNRNRNTSGFWTGGGTNELVTVPVIYLDSPATTSATTYKLQITKATGATRTYYLNRNARYTDFGYDGTYMSSIIAMEIAA
jgi:hypothetical protein